jgi:hypothetical protein
MRLNVDISGLSELTRQMGALKGDADATIAKVITGVVLETHRRAVTGIQRGPKTGLTYKRRGVMHRASAPGQYPATDTGTLASRVDFNLPTASNLRGSVGTNIFYGPMLEFGTSKMAARPWLLPSFRQAVAKSESKLKAEWEART